MTPLEFINQDRQRVTARLDKLEPECILLRTQLAELDSAQTVLERFASAKKLQTSVDAGTTQLPARLRGRPRKPADSAAAGPAAGAAGAAGAPTSATQPGKPGKPSLGEATLRVVQAHAAGATAQSVTTGLLGMGITAQPNHIGIALSRHAKAGRLEKRDDRWYAIGGPPMPNGAQREDRPAALK